VLLALLLGLASMATAAPAPPASSSSYGALLDFRRTEDPATLRASFEQARAAGIGWMRIDFFWHLIEPREGRLQWSRYDAITQAAKASGIRLLGILDYTAPWASRDPAGRDDKQPPREPASFARYALQTVERYRDTVAAWQVWNEPDHPSFWKGSAGDYARLLVRVYPAIKAANPAAPVVLGGLAEGGTADPRFLDSVLAVCRDLAHPCFDVLAFHTNFRSPADVRRQFATNRQRLAAWGVAAPIWVTEASYTSDARQQTLPGYQDGAAAQARYLADTVPLSLELGAARVFWATLYDYRAEHGRYTASGLLGVDGRSKPAYDALRRLTGRLPGKDGEEPR
jgi:hypothetical protein